MAKKMSIDVSRPVDPETLYFRGQDHKGRPVNIPCSKMEEVAGWTGQRVFVSQCDTRACQKNGHRDCPHKKESARAQSRTKPSRANLPAAGASFPVRHDLIAIDRRPSVAAVS